MDASSYSIVENKARECPLVEKDEVDLVSAVFLTLHFQCTVNGQNCFGYYS